MLLYYNKIQDKSTGVSSRRHYHATCNHRHKGGPKGGMIFHHHQLEKIQKHQRAHIRILHKKTPGEGGSFSVVRSVLWNSVIWRYFNNWACDDIASDFDGWFYRLFLCFFIVRQAYLKAFSKSGCRWCPYSEVSPCQEGIHSPSLSLLGGFCVYLPPVPHLFILFYFLFLIVLLWSG